MTKVNAKSNAITTYDASQLRKTRVTTKAKTTSRETPSIVLKTLHDDIMRDNANATITTKQMRVWLRANMRDVHERNTSWIFTQSQYDIVRAQFDAKYRATLERRAKRDAKSNDTPKSTRKRATKTNVDPIATNVDTNVPNVNNDMTNVVA